MHNKSAGEKNALPRRDRLMALGAYITRNSVSRNNYKVNCCRLIAFDLLAFVHSASAVICPQMHLQPKHRLLSLTEWVGISDMLKGLAVAPHCGSAYRRLLVRSHWPGIRGRILHWRFVCSWVGGWRFAGPILLSVCCSTDPLHLGQQIALWWICDGYAHVLAQGQRAAILRWNFDTDIRYFSA